jgi:hypothetical protein
MPQAQLAQHACPHGRLAGCRDGSAQITQIPSPSAATTDAADGVADSATVAAAAVPASTLAGGGRGLAAGPLMVPLMSDGMHCFLCVFHAVCWQLRPQYHADWQRLQQEVAPRCPQFAQNRSTGAPNNSIG